MTDERKFLLSNKLQDLIKEYHVNVEDTLELLDDSTLSREQKLLIKQTINLQAFGITGVVIALSEELLNIG